MEQSKEKDLLKQFLTYNLVQDYDDKQKREKFVEIFRNLVMSDEPEMKQIVLSMFDSFNKYQETIDNPVDDKEPETASTTEETPADNEATPAEDSGPTEEDMMSQFESYKIPYLERINDMLGW